MMSDFIIHCFVANILFGIAAGRYGFKRKRTPGVFYVLISLGASVLWTFAGTVVFSHFSFKETLSGSVLFFVWNLAALLPWGLLCFCKYKSSEPWSFWIGISGVLAQLALIAGVTCLAAEGGLRKGLDIDKLIYVSRYCGFQLLLFSAPGFVLTALASALMKDYWENDQLSLTLVAWICAFFFFFIGVGALRLSV